MLEITVAGRRRIAVCAALFFSVLLLGTAVSADARVSPKDGAYLQSSTKPNRPFGYISTDKGKVNGAGGSLRFIDSKGKSCVPEGLYATAGLTGVSLVARSNARPNGRGNYRIAIKSNAAYPKLRGTVTGKFISRNVATISFNLSSGTCKAKSTFKSAKFTAGG